MLKAIYPDGDEVSYKYYPTGELSSISSDLFGDVQSIVESINYDGRGNIDEMVYGNGTITNYEYADRTWTLMGSMVIGKPVGGSTAVALLDRTYSYNSLGGIGTMQRVMDQSLVQPGETDHTFNFSYDSYKRLLEGKLDIAGVGPSYEVSTNYNDAGGITSKFSKVEPGTQTLANNAAAMSYDIVYNYNPAKPHQLEEAVDQMSGNTQHFTYNASGSIKQIQDNSQTQDFFWNEEQWLNAVQNEQGIHHYVYDDKGERIMKSSVIQSNVYVNDQVVNTIQDLEPYTLYVNPYFVITEFSNADKVSKHYYMGSQRVASELAVQSNNYSPLVNEQSTSGNATFTQESYNAEKSSGSTLGQILESPLQPKSANLWLNNLNEALTEFGKKTLTLEETQKELPTIESIYPDLSPQTNYKTASTQRVFYWYHPDYIGNVDLVTDLNGEAYELFLYNPWGENLYEWNSGTSSWSSPYRFNGKELDQETGLAYYGARYYANQLSMWLSVDPMASKMPNVSPYSYCFDNPLKFTDPTGAIPTPVEGAIIARHIYDGKIGEVVEGRWRLDKVYRDKNNSAYRAGLYSRTVNGVTEYTMANAGTYFENTKRGRGSISEDIEQPLGGSENMRVSITDAKRVSKDIGDSELTFVGHSKGGAEAAGNALATNRNAMLYNPAAISSEAYGLDTDSYTGADDNGMTAFIVKGDMLNTFINSWTAKPIDKAVYLPQQSNNPVTNHLIDTMISALREYYKTKE
jgi:RHS repeat-associated protein